jgi:hypothetical protein
MPPLNQPTQLSADPAVSVANTAAMPRFSASVASAGMNVM